MTSQNPTIELLLERWCADYQIKDEDIEYLLRLLRVNLHDLVLAIRKAGRHRQWSELSLLNHKLEGLALNLNWEKLRKLGAFMSSAIENRHEVHLDALLDKLSSLHEDLESAFHGKL